MYLVATLFLYFFSDSKNLLPCINLGADFLWIVGTQIFLRQITAIIDATRCTLISNGANVPLTILLISLNKRVLLLN
ncbi:hypothetical protein D3C74_447590 [compost metagenome]